MSHINMNTRFKVEAQLGPWKASKMERFGKIVNSRKPLTIVTKLNTLEFMKILAVYLYSSTGISQRNSLTLKLSIIQATKINTKEKKTVKTKL